MSLPYSVDDYTGSLTVTPAAPNAGERGRFRIWRYLGDADAVELHQVTASGSGYRDTLRFHQNSANFSVDQDGYCLVSVDAWTAADSGDWYAIHYRSNSMWFFNAYLSGGARLDISGSEPAPVPLGLYDAEASNGNAYVTLRGDSVTGKLFFAAYDSNGRFLKAAITTPEESGRHTVPLDLTNAATVSVFLIDGEGRPLCAPAHAAVR